MLFYTNGNGDVIDSNGKGIICNRNSSAGPVLMDYSGKIVFPFDNEPKSSSSKTSKSKVEKKKPLKTYW